MKLSFQPYKVILKRTPYVAVALFLVQTISGIREGNEVQVVDESDFNVYASDATMSSSPSFEEEEEGTKGIRGGLVALEVGPSFSGFHLS